MTIFVNQLHFFSALFLWGSFGTEVLTADGYTSSSNIRYFFYQSAEYPRDCREAFEQCPNNNSTSGVFLIKPDQIPEPIEIYCENNFPSGGWTVIQRRLDGSINFNRTWEDYKHGFGFIGSEFWIGNEKLAYLTNQNRYVLRIDLQYTDGQSHYVTYDNFRIKDEWNHYSLFSLNLNYDETDVNYSGCYIQEREIVLRDGESYLNAVCSSMITCRNDELDRQNYRCSDDARCESSSGVGSCICNQGFTGNGVTCDPLPCYIPEINRVLSNGETYISSGCTRNSTCSGNSLNVDRNYRCSNDATCDERNGVRKCYCNDGYEGDGVTCSPEVVPKDCQELFVAGTTRNDVYTIYPDGYPGGIEVYCDMESNGGGWTIVQRRSTSSVNFNRNWSDYKNGFGNRRYDHWLGNKYIHAITNQKTYQLRIDMRDSRSSSYHAIYSTFSINDERNKYRLSVGSYSGNAGDDNLALQNGEQFSTRDEDNDPYSRYHCAQRHTGGWWHAGSGRCCNGCTGDRPACSRHCGCSGHGCGSGEAACRFFQDGSYCGICSVANLNGDYDGSARGTNIFWDGLAGYDCGIKFTEMKIRPV